MRDDRGAADLPITPHRNFVTVAGLVQIEAVLAAAMADGDGQLPPPSLAICAIGRSAKLPPS